MVIVNMNNEEKEKESRLSKLLQDLDVPETKITEKMMKDLLDKYGNEVPVEDTFETQVYDNSDNPFKVNHSLMEEINDKLKNLYNISDGTIDGSKVSSDLIRKKQTTISANDLLLVNIKLKQFEKVKISKSTEKLKSLQP